MNYVGINNDFYRCPEFLKFAKLDRSRMLEFNIAHIVRDSVEVRKPSHGAHWIYKEYFCKGDLVSRYSQEDLAKYFGTKQPNISREMSALHKDKLLQKKRVNRYSTTLLYYKVGYWTGELDNKNTYKETLFLDIVFGAYSKIAAEDRRNDKSLGNMTELKMALNDLDPDSMWYEDDKKHFEDAIIARKKHDKKRSNISR